MISRVPPDPRPSRTFRAVADTPTPIVAVPPLEMSAKVPGPGTELSAQLPGTFHEAVPEACHTFCARAVSARPRKIIAGRTADRRERQDLLRVIMKGIERCISAAK